MYVVISWPWPEHKNDPKAVPYFLRQPPKRDFFTFAHLRWCSRASQGRCILRIAGEAEGTAIHFRFSPATLGARKIWGMWRCDQQSQLDISWWFSHPILRSRRDTLLRIRVPFSTYLVTTVAFVHGHHYKFCLPLELPYLQNQSKLDSKCWYWQESIQLRRFAVETFVNQSCPHKAFLGICGHFDLLLQPAVNLRKRYYTPMPNQPFLWHSTIYPLVIKHGCGESLKIADVRAKKTSVFLMEFPSHVCWHPGGVTQILMLSCTRPNALFLQPWLWTISVFPIKNASYPKTRTWKLLPGKSFTDTFTQQFMEPES